MSRLTRDAQLAIDKYKGMLAEVISYLAGERNPDGAITAEIIENLIVDAIEAMGRQVMTSKGVPDAKD